MAIRITTSMSEIDALIKAETERVDKIAIQALSNLGDMCVAKLEIEHKKKAGSIKLVI